MMLPDPVATNGTRSSLARVASRVEAARSDTAAVIMPTKRLLSPETGATATSSNSPLPSEKRNGPAQKGTRPVLACCIIAATAALPDRSIVSET